MDVAAAPGVRRARLATAMVVDSFGSGLFGPFGLLYATVVVGLPLPVAGVALGVVGLLALVSGPVAGALVDRLGAVRVAVAGNVLAAVGGGLLLIARDLALFVVASLLSAAAMRVFWAAFAPLVGDAVEPVDRERWFGLLRAARYAGVAAGGLAASAALLLGPERGLLIMVSVDAASFALAGVLLATSRVPVRVGAPPASIRPDDADRAAGRAPASYRDALRDRESMALAGLNVAATLLITAPVIAMPVYVLEVLRLPAWLPGALAATGTAALALAVTQVHRVTHGRRRLLVLATACLLWAAGALAAGLAGIAAGSAGGLALLALFAAVVVLGLGEALHGPTADTVPLVLAPPGMAGRYSALHQAAWGLSGAFAPALVGVLLAHDPRVLWLSLTALGLGAALVYRALPARAHERARTVGAREDAAPPD